LGAPIAATKEQINHSRRRAGSIEDAFQTKLANFLAPTAAGPEHINSAKHQLNPREARTFQSKRQSSQKGIDKTALTLAEPRRVRDRDHVRFVATHPCLVCGRQPSDAHHLRFAQSRAFGRKVSDEFTVPLCRGHHREVHRHGNEVAWWEKVGLDPSIAARALWLETHPMATGSGKLPVIAVGALAAKPASSKKDRRVGQSQNPL
jgi:hypothetical protein